MANLLVIDKEKLCPVCQGNVEPYFHCPACLGTHCELIPLAQALAELGINVDRRRNGKPRSTDRQSSG